MVRVVVNKTLIKDTHISQILDDQKTRLEINSPYMVVKYILKNYGTKFTHNNNSRY